MGRALTMKMKTSIKSLPANAKPHVIFRDGKWRVMAGNRTVELTDRTKQMLELRRLGLTLDQIGKGYGVTRERVRQLVGPWLPKNEGGRTRQVARHKEAVVKVAIRRRDQRIKRLWGISAQQFDALCERYGPASGYKSPFMRYRSQKRNMGKNYGAEWKLTFPQWWAAWEESGKFNQCGRGNGYALTRIDQSGAFEVGNIVIRTCAENAAQKFLPPRNFSPLQRWRRKKDASSS